MKLKIFNSSVACLILLCAALSQRVTAQEVPAVPPLPPEPQVWVAPKFDDKELQQKMKSLQLKMNGLQKQMSKLRVEQMKKMQQTLALNQRKFNDSFKRLDLTEPLKALNNISVDMDQPDVNVSVDSKQTYQHEKIKTYSKTYPADADDILQISNSFGKVTVNTWDRKEFKVDVQMKISSDDEDTANDMINGTNISDSKAGSVVSFKTNLYHGGNNRHSNQSIDINYTVYMPAKNQLEVVNRFGAIIIPDRAAKTVVNLSYGNLTAHQLTNPQNEINVRFGNADIDALNGGKVEVAYGKLKIGTADRLSADIKFSSIDVNKLRTSGDITVKYGNGFRVSEIDPNLKSLNVDASFTNVALNLKNTDAFDFDITTKFGNFNYDADRIKVVSKSPSDEEHGFNPTKTYKGYYNKNSSNAKVYIKANYGSVKFDQ